MITLIAFTNMVLKTNTLLISLILGASIIIAALIYANSRTQAGQNPSSDKQEPLIFMQRQDAWVDFDGNGEDELVLAFTKDSFFEEKEVNLNEYLAVYDKDGKEIARSPQGWRPINSTHPGNMEAYKFDTNSKKEYLRLTNVAGAHQFQYLFLRLTDGKLEMVCTKGNTTDMEDCVFYSTRGSILVEDIDHDGLIDIAEPVDEYPRGGGRGREVIWGIYSWNGEYFDPQIGASYDRLFDILAKDDSSLMKRSDMSDASVDNLEMVKSFWDRGD